MNRDLKSAIYHLKQIFRHEPEIGGRPVSWYRIYGQLENLAIGKYTSIARDTVFLMKNHNRHFFSTYCFGGTPQTEGWCIPEGIAPEKKIVVGNDVWIGINSVICPGVTLGDGCLVAAGSVVTKNVKPYAIVQGNPAKFVGYRFNGETIAYLKALKWWDFPEWFVDEIYPLLCSNDIITLQAAMFRARLANKI